MADTPSLFPELSLLSLPGRFVNPRCVIRELDGTRVAFVDGAWFHTWPAEDRIAETLFVVQVSHRTDIPPVRRVQAGELRNDNIDHIQHFYIKMSISHKSPSTIARGLH